MPPRTFCSGADTRAAAIERLIDSLESFYKNLGIMGGLLLLYITGAGKYSIDAVLGL